MTGDRELGGKLVDPGFEICALVSGPLVVEEVLVELLELPRPPLHLPGYLHGLVDHLHHLLEVLLNEPSELRYLSINIIHQHAQ